MSSSVPRQLYQEHLTHNHPDFVRWDKRTSYLLVPIIILAITSTLLFLGSFAGDSLSNGTLAFGSLFTLSLGLIAIFALIRVRGKRRFQILWNEAHPTGIATGAVSDSSFQHEIASSGARLEVSSPEDYLAALSLRLSDATFRVQRAIRADPYLFDLVAVRPAVQIGGFRDAVIVTTIDAPTLDKVEEFSAFAMKYAVDNKSQLGLGSGDTLNLYSVIVSNSLGDEIKKGVGDTRPGGSSMHGRTTLPVLIAMDEQQTYYYTKTPISGGLRYRTLRNFADEYIALRSPITR